MFYSLLQGGSPPKVYGLKVTSTAQGHAEEEFGYRAGPEEHKCPNLQRAGTGHPTTLNPKGFRV